MATEILMPKLGLTMTEGLIQKWLVQVGDTVTSGQPLLEISSEKLTSEVESPASGVVLDKRKLQLKPLKIQHRLVLNLLQHL